MNNYDYEEKLINNGINLIAGVDEVGRGPLVGPVVAAAVILPKNYVLEGLTDSKKLSEKKRNYFYEIIKKDAIAYSICEVDNNEIDRINIYEATKLAMIKAINELKIKPEHVLIDAMKLDIDIPTTSIIKGDLKSLSISAASVIAKVYRDNLMKEYSKKYPIYEIEKNKGYPTKKHLEMIEKYGVTNLYRKSYQPVKKVLLKTSKNHEKSCGAIIYYGSSDEILFLLLKHTKGHWSFSKGHVENIETEEETAKREILEETGLNLEINTNFKYTTTYFPKENTIKDVTYFIAKSNNKTCNIQQEEIIEYKWLNYNEALNLITYNDDKDILKQAYKFIKHIK